MLFIRFCIQVDPFSSNTSQYTLQMTAPPPFPKVTNDTGRRIRDGDKIALSSKSSSIRILPSSFLLGVHAQYANSLRCLGLYDQILKGWPKDSLGQKIRDLPRAIVHRSAFLIRNVWLRFPTSVRISMYKSLLYMGSRMYGK